MAAIGQVYHFNYTEATYETGENWVTKHLQHGGTLDEVTGLKQPENWMENATFDAMEYAISSELPKTWDWREVKQLQPIRNQGGCGSCWDFSVTAVMESLHRLIHPEFSPMVDTAEQAVLSCSGTGSCGGGYFDAFDYLVKSGSPWEHDFPYQARNLRCKQGLKPIAKLTSWSYIGAAGKKPTTAQLKQAIYDHGPISVDVNGSFASYKSGVYNTCGGTRTNHMVTIEGWVDDAKYEANGGGYWIMRNSWGTSWGEQGYMRIVYKSRSGANCNGIGQIAAYAVMEGIDNVREHVGVK
jgi:C1A family cysteine protease